MIGLIVLGLIGVIALVLFGLLALLIVPLFITWVPVAIVGVIMGVVTGIRWLAGLAWFIIVGVASLLKAMVSALL